MTETTTRPAQSLVASIRHAKEPGGAMSDLSAQARRLRKSIAVLEKWTTAAMEDLSAELATLAETTHDQLEEELARVVWEMELERRKREYHDAGRDVPEEVARHALLSDTLLACYCVLVSAPEDVFGIAEGDYSNDMKRYSMMGALLVAQEAAEAGVERVKAEPK
jgi:hypothetical protein